MVSFIPFTDYCTLSSDVRQKAGLVTLGLTGLFLASNMLILLGMSIWGLIEPLCKKCRNNKEKEGK